MPTIKIVPFPGSAGSVGPAGPRGIQGPQGPAGNDALWNFSGTYNNSATYAIGDVVSYNGSTWYRSQVGAPGQLPSSESSVWEIVAASGSGVPVGGLTGEYLAKTSTDNYEVGWVDPSVVKLRKVSETFTTINAASGVVIHNCTNGHIFNHTAPTANFTANLTNLNLDSGYATTVTLIMNQPSVARIPNALQINGQNISVNWQGGSIPTGFSNKKDIVSFSIINNGGTYAAFGQLVTFG
jgi:hypothetical protein